MAKDIIYLADIVRTKSTGTEPKMEARTHHNQRYILQFRPGAPAGQRWHWLVKYTCVYEYHGDAATLDKADRAARRKIEDLENRTNERTA